MKKTYKKRFLLRLKEATRAGWACLLVASLLLYVPRIQNIMSVPVLAPLLAILVAGPPLGTVLHTSVGILSVTLPAVATTMIVLQILSPPISRFATIACTGISSYLIAFLSGTHLLGRKMAIGQICIVYVTAHYDPSTNVVLFPLKMIVPTVLGLGIAIFATLFPFPWLAVLQVRKSARSSAHAESKILKSLIKTYSATDETTYSAMNLHTRILAKAAVDALLQLESKQVNIWWEFKACGAQRANKRFTKSLQSLNLHLAGMLMALESGSVLHAPENLRSNLAATLTKVSDHCQLLLDIAVEFLQKFSTTAADGMRRQKLVEEGKEILNLFDKDWLSAREIAFYTSGPESFHALAAASELWHDSLTQSTSPQLAKTTWKFRGRVSSLFFLFNLRLYFVEAIDLVTDGKNRPKKMHQIARIEPPVDSAFTDSFDKSINNSHLGSEGGEKTLQSSSLQDTSHHGINRLSSARLHRESSSFRQSSHRSAVFTDDALPSVSVSMLEIGNQGNATTTDGVSSHRSDPHMQRQCSHSHAIAMEKTIKAAGGSDSRFWNFMKTLGVAPNKAQNIRAFKTALSIILATLLGLLVLEGKAQAFWAPVTVAFIIGNFQGGSWRISSLRLQGTVLGSVYGFLALTASNNHRWAILLLLVPWVIFASFIRYSHSYGYSGLVAAFTAAIMMLGGAHDDIKQFAMDRITETFVGIICFVFVETVILPERAVVLVRRELVSSLISLRDTVAAIVSVYTEQQCTHCRGLAVKEIKLLEQTLRTSFAKQTDLSKEAALEPDLWFVPFPGDVYTNLIGIQGRMLDLLYFMVCSLHATTEDCFAMTEQLEKLVTPLRASLTAVQDEVLSTIDSLHEALQATAVKHGTFQRLKKLVLSRFRQRSTGNSDVEVSQDRSRPNLRPHHPKQQALLVLRHRHRSVDGSPLNLISTMANFELSFESVIDELTASTKADRANKQILSNSVIASVSSLTFSLYCLLTETVHLEKEVHELLQAESPWSELDFCDAFSLTPLTSHHSDTVVPQS